MNRVKTWVEVSSQALRHNVGEIKRLTTPAAIMAVVKSNSYGHGLLEVAHAVNEDVDAFGVDSIDEGMLLRQHDYQLPVVILGYLRCDRVTEAVRHDLSFTVYDAVSVKHAACAGSRLHPARLHLKIETGLHRQGMHEDQLASILRIIRRERYVAVEGISTHYANVEDARDDSYAQKQLERFTRACTMTQSMGFEPRWRHTACSAAAILYPATHFNMIRLGIALYGLWPSQTALVHARALGRRLALRPAMTWKTIVAQVKRVSRGTPVGYGLSEKLKRDSVIAVLPVGYADGYDRGFSRQSEVLIHGKRCRIIGRVCMNMCVADVTDISRVRTEDVVVLLGRQKTDRITADELAEKIGTINYEIVNRVNPLISRIVVA